MKTEKPFPALCLGCKHSKPEKGADWNNRCFHPKVIASDSWALANNNEGQPCGVNCRDQRGKRSLFAPCGMKGKLWEPKTEVGVSRRQAVVPPGRRAATLVHASTEVTVNPE